MSELAGAGMTVASLLQQSGYNHARADAHSNIDGDDVVDTRTYQPGTAQSIAMVSLQGGGIFELPAGWEWAADPFGGVWPDGHPDKLRQVAEAWKTAAGKLDGLWDSVGNGMSALDGQQSPELEHARVVCRSLGEAASALAEQCRAIGDAVESHADQIEKVRGEVTKELSLFVQETIAIEAGALIVGIATGGIGAGGMQAAESAAAARAWQRVKGILATLSAAASSSGGKLVAVHVIDGVSDSLKGILKLTPKVAETAPVASGLKAMKELANKLADSKWPLGPATRGFELEARYGGNLPPSFPTIDKFDQLTGVATSIKSTDLAAKTYQDPNKLRRLITGYIDKMAGFNGKQFSGTNILSGDISERELLLIIPRGATPEQQAVLAEMAEYARQKGVTWTLEISR
ncbi:hypothetical protein ACFWHR_04750 [Leucobacter sp. NPDC058333]|uniref:endonuclease toxin domain-containing protein n=1 Tax=Leucobacter sp. NPDC058333 TaxID=3346450 RepID=UPI0036470A5A